MLKSVEKAILGAIAIEAEAVAGDINGENKNNADKVKASELYREKVIREMTRWSIAKPKWDEKPGQKVEKPDQKVDKAMLVYEQEEVNEVKAVIEKNIENALVKSSVLSKLIKEGEGIANELEGEKPEKISDSKISLTDLSEETQEESMILSKVEE
jgi:hypothetical protein